MTEKLADAKSSGTDGRPRRRGVVADVYPGSFRNLGPRATAIMAAMDAVRTITTAVSHIHLNEAGILEVRILPGVEQSKHMAQENIAACLRCAEGQERPLLLDLTEAEPLEASVRRYYAGKEVYGAFKAIALLVSASPFGLAMGNFYISVARGMRNHKLFHDREEALAWLRSFI